MIPGWPYSFVAALGRAGPAGPAARRCSARPGRRRDQGDSRPGPRRRGGSSPRALAPRRPGLVVVFDASDDLTRLAWLLRDLAVEVLGGCAATG